MVECFWVILRATKKRFHTKVTSVQCYTSLSVLCPPKQSSVEEYLIGIRIIYLRRFAATISEIIVREHKIARERNNMAQYSKFCIRWGPVKGQKNQYLTQKSKYRWIVTVEWEQWYSFIKSKYRNRRVEIVHKQKSTHEIIKAVHSFPAYKEQLVAYWEI